MEEAPTAQPAIKRAKVVVSGTKGKKTATSTAIIVETEALHDIVDGRRYHKNEDADGLYLYVDGKRYRTQEGDAQFVFLSKFDYSKYIFKF